MSDEAADFRVWIVVRRVWIVVRYDYDEHQILSVCETKEVGLAWLDHWVAKDDADKQESQRRIEQKHQGSIIRWWPLSQNERQIDLDEVRQVRDPGPTYALQPWALLNAKPSGSAPGEGA